VGRTARRFQSSTGFTGRGLKLRPIHRAPPNARIIRTPQSRPAERRPPRPVAGGESDCGGPRRKL
jgi:hypothetical protein